MIEDPEGALAGGCSDLSFNRFTSFVSKDTGPVIIYSARAEDAECAADFFGMDGLPDAASVLAGEFQALADAGIEGQVRGFLPWAKIELPDGGTERVKFEDAVVVRATEANIEALVDFGRWKVEEGESIDGYSVFAASLPFGREGVDLLFMRESDKASPLPFSVDDFADALESRWKIEFLRDEGGKVKSVLLSDFDPATLGSKIGRAVDQPLDRDAAATVALTYEAILDRNGEIDREGLNFWATQRSLGLTEKEMARLFLQSGEFESRFGPVDELGDRELVEILYESVLDRKGEKDGADFWTRQLENGFGRDELALAFAKSGENRENAPFVDALEEVLPGVWDIVSSKDGSTDRLTEQDFLNAVDLPIILEGRVAAEGNGGWDLA